MIFFFSLQLCQAWAMSEPLNWTATIGSSGEDPRLPNTPCWRSLSTAPRFGLQTKLLLPSLRRYIQIRIHHWIRVDKYIVQCWFRSYQFGQEPSQQEAKPLLLPLKWKRTLWIRTELFSSDLLLRIAAWTGQVAASCSRPNGNGKERKNKPFTFVKIKIDIQNIGSDIRWARYTDWPRR